MVGHRGGVEGSSKAIKIFMCQQAEHQNECDAACPTLLPLPTLAIAVRLGELLHQPRTFLIGQSNRGATIDPSRDFLGCRDHSRMAATSKVLTDLDQSGPGVLSSQPHREHAWVADTRRDLFDDRIWFGVTSNTPQTADSISDNRTIGLLQRNTSSSVSAAIFAVIGVFQAML